MLLLNPVARRGPAEFASLRSKLALRLNLVGAAMPASAADLAREVEGALGQGVRRFVVAGGDGTLSRVAAHLQGTGAALGVLPWGTGNTFAHGVGLPGRLPELLDVLCRGCVHRYDVGIAESHGERRAFLNSLTLGVSQRLATLLTPGIKRRFGWLAWPFAIERALRTTPQVQVRLRYDDGRNDAFATLQLIVANGRALAGPLRATPSASGQDGRLEVFSLGAASPLACLRSAAQTALGRHIHDPRAHYRACTRVEVTSEPPVALDLDGDVWGRTPVTCRVLPAALHVLVPGAQQEQRTGVATPVRMRERLR